MRYSTNEKEIIADKLLAGIPPHRIVEDMTASTSENLEQNDMIKKIDLLNEKDIWNIAQSFDICVKHPHREHSSDDIAAVDKWTTTNKESVLFYKRQGEVDRSEYKLCDEDFVLVMMNMEQKKKFEQYSSKAILVDGTHGVSKVRMELVRKRTSYFIQFLYWMDTSRVIRRAS